jgi:hypothetical protein
VPGRQPAGWSQAGGQQKSPYLPDVTVMKRGGSCAMELEPHPGPQMMPTLPRPFILCVGVGRLEPAPTPSRPVLLLGLRVSSTSNHWVVRARWPLPFQSSCLWNPWTPALWKDTGKGPWFPTWREDWMERIFSSQCPLICSCMHAFIHSFIHSFSPHLWRTSHVWEGLCQGLWIQSQVQKVFSDFKKLRV